MLLYFYIRLALGLWDKEVEEHIRRKCNRSKQPVGSMLTQEGLQKRENLGYDKDGQGPNANRESCNIHMNILLNTNY